MDKNTIFYISLLAILFILSGYFIVYGIETVDYAIFKPLNNTFNSSTNSTQPFIFKYTNSTNATAPCTVYLNGAAVAMNQSRTGQNNSVQSNTSFNEGYNSWYVSCINGTSNNQPSGVYDLIIDTTAPNNVFINAPSDEYNTTNSTMFFTVGGFDNIGDYYNNKAARFDVMINGTNNLSQYYYANDTAFSFTIAGFYDGLYQYNVSIRDNRSYSKNTTSQYFRVDSTAPVLANYNVVNVSGTATTSGNMVARVNFSATDAQLPIHSAYVKIFSNGTSKTVYGTLSQNTTGRVIMNQVDIAPSDITYDGVFTIQPHANDTLGNDVTGTNQTNWTKVTLKTGWNLIQIQNNQTLFNVSQMSNEITQVSRWNTTAYETYTVGTSTNSLIPVNDSNTVFVYSRADVGILRKWTFDGGVMVNKTLTTGWNTMSVFNNSIQLYDACNIYIFNNTASSIKAVSYYDSKVPTYYSQVCSIRSGFNNNVTIPRGFGFWINVNLTAWTPIAR